MTVTFPRSAAPVDQETSNRSGSEAGRQRPESRRESGLESPGTGRESLGAGLESLGAGLESLGAGLESAGSGLELKEAGLKSLELRVLALLAAEPLSRSGIAGVLGHQSMSAGLNRVIHRLLRDGRIAYTVPAKPNSRLQKYRITQAGRFAWPGA